MKEVNEVEKYAISSLSTGDRQHNLIINNDDLPIVECDDDLMSLINSVLTQPESNVLMVALDEARRVGLGLRTSVAYEITPKAYARMAGKAQDADSFSELKAAVNKLFKNEVCYAKGETGVWVRARLISSTSTIASEEYFEIKITDLVVDLLNSRKDVKDSFSLKMISNQDKMSDEHSKVFYELLLNNYNYLNYKQFKASIGEVYSLINYKPKQAPVELAENEEVRLVFDESEFVSIMEPIVANINKHTELTISEFTVANQVFTTYA